MVMDVIMTALLSGLCNQMITVEKSNGLFILTKPTRHGRKNKYPGKNFDIGSLLLFVFSPFMGENLILSDVMFGTVD